LKELRSLERAEHFHYVISSFFFLVCLFLFGLLFNLIHLYFL